MDSTEELRKRITANFTPDDMEHANGDPDYLADLIAARTGDDPKLVAEEVRAMFPRESAPPPRAATAEPSEHAEPPEVQRRAS